MLNSINKKNSFINKSFACKHSSIVTWKSLLRRSCLCLIIYSSILIFTFSYIQNTFNNQLHQQKQIPSISSSISSSSSSSSFFVLSMPASLQDRALPSLLDNQMLQQQQQQPINEVLGIEILKQENCVRQFTCNYKQRFSSPAIVLRRGSFFKLIVRTRRQLNATLHKFRIEFHYGPKPKLSTKTLIFMPVFFNSNNNNNSDKNNTQSQTEDDELSELELKDEQTVYSWNAKANIIQQQTTQKFQQLATNKMIVSVRIPVDAAIGIWHVKISAKNAPVAQLDNSTLQQADQLIKTVALAEPFYIIFNPWNLFDDVYLSNQEQRQEYLLNEIGKIYIGTYERPVGRKWTYGQFSEAALPAVMSLLEKSRLTIEDRGNVVKVSRAVSAVVNSHDENGLLVGNWSGNYHDGMAPWKWTGSTPIFERYLATQRPVKFAQCWVFGGITTTALRTLGIPARTVSNFASAHDTDSSLTIDKLISESGEVIEGLTGDSTWNFHVWSDAWMARDDLPPGFGGWQTIDATPQEPSMGRYQAGPASLNAVKQGRVDLAYDAGFVFSEVNADVVNWKWDTHRGKAHWRKVSTFKNQVGKKIFTKKVNVLDDYTRFKVSDAQDIVGQYKFLEGTEEERAAVKTAAKLSGVSLLFDSQTFGGDM